MNYSKNKHGNPYNSNSSVKYNQEWKSAPLLVRVKLNSICIIVIFLRMFGIMSIYLNHSTNLFNSGKIKNPKWMWYDQRFRAWLRLYGYEFGLHEEIQEIKSNRVVFHFNSNLYLEYELSDSAKDYLHSIKLLRHLHNFYKFGKYHEIRQDGWDLIFDFNQIPDKGCVGIKYL
jgi:hypothetical protein